jgi:hypothetical protein
MAGVYPTWHTRLELTERETFAESGEPQVTVDDVVEKAQARINRLREEVADRIDLAKYNLDGGSPAPRTPRLQLDGGDPAPRVADRVFNAVTGPEDDLEKILRDYVASNFVDASTYNTDIADIEQQIDNSITTWYASGAPTLNNYPAQDWTDDATKDTHLNDLYYDKDTGDAYRFLYDGDNDTHGWEAIVDQDVQQALTAAQDAQDVADQKRRVFVAEPVPPYDIGDLWAQGGSGDREIKRAVVAQPAPGDGGAFNAGDWIAAAEYDAKAQEFVAQFNGDGLDGGDPSPRTGNPVDGGNPNERTARRRYASGGPIVTGQNVTYEAQRVADEAAIAMGFSGLAQLKEKLSGRPEFFINADPNKGPVGAALINFDLIDTDALIANLVSAGSLFARAITFENVFQSLDYQQGTQGVKFDPINHEYEFNGTIIAGSGSSIDYGAVSGTKPPSDADKTSDAFNALNDANASGIAFQTGTGNFKVYNNGTIEAVDGVFSGAMTGGSININSGTFEVTSLGQIKYEEEKISLGQGAGATGTTGVAIGKGALSAFGGIAIGKGAQTFNPNRRSIMILNGNGHGLHFFSFTNVDTKHSVFQAVEDSGLIGSLEAQGCFGSVKDGANSQSITRMIKRSNEVEFYTPFGTQWLEVKKDDYSTLNGELHFLMLG